MFPKIGVPPNHPILIGFSIISHPFWRIPIFGNTHIPAPWIRHGDISLITFLSCKLWGQAPAFSGGLEDWDFVLVRVTWWVGWFLHFHHVNKAYSTYYIDSIYIYSTCISYLYIYKLLISWQFDKSIFGGMVIREHFWNRKVTSNDVDKSERIHSITLMNLAEVSFNWQKKQVGSILVHPGKINILNPTKVIQVDGRWFPFEQKWVEF